MNLVNPSESEASFVSKWLLAFPFARCERTLNQTCSGQVYQTPKLLPCQVGGWVQEEKIQDAKYYNYYEKQEGKGAYPHQILSSGACYQRSSRRPGCPAAVCRPSGRLASLAGGGQARAHWLLLIYSKERGEERKRETCIIHQFFLFYIAIG